MISPSRWRYEYVMPNIIGPNEELKYGIAVYNEGKEYCKIKHPARVMICYSYNYFITICITKHFVFPLLPWNWIFYNKIKKEINFIKKYKDMFFKYWNNEDIYGYEIADILILMEERNISEDKAVYIIKHKFDEDGEYFI